MTQFRSAVLTAVALAFACVTAAPAAPPTVQFNRDIRPILNENCFACHGPDAKQAKGDLRIHLRESAIVANKKGDIAIVPGKPDESSIVKRIFTTDPKTIMPPPDSHKTLKPEQKELLKAWITQGAEYQKHWAYIAPVRPELPAVQNANWPRNEIDRFILAKLESRKLSPSPEADKRTLIRRVTFDLTGLPPTLEEVRAFVDDKSPDAYEKLVDRLFKSPHYGERMTMWWLDGAHYADSNGYQSDWQRFQWPWRDWVIDAFNDNKRFDQFTIEQVAGDLLPNATTEQRVATGFYRNHRINTEGGTIAQEWLVETCIDRVDTTSQVFLGLTLGCARCHDHKYDPFTQKDFYSLFSYFYNVPEKGNGDAESPVSHAPKMRAPTRADLIAIAELDATIAAQEKALKEKEGSIPALQAAWEKSATAAAVANAKSGTTWTVIQPTEVKALSGAEIKKQPDASMLVTGTVPENDQYTISFAPTVKQITALRLEALPDPSLGGKGPGRPPNGNFVLSDVRVTVDGKPVKLVSSSADFSQDGFPVAAAIDADPVASGWAIHPKTGEPHTAIFGFDKSIESAAPIKLTVELLFKAPYSQHQLGHFRLSVTDSGSPHQAADAIAQILVTEPAKRTAEQKQQLTTYFTANHAGDITAIQRSLTAARQKKAAAEQSFPELMVMQEMPKPREAHVLIRGQYDKLGPIVTAAVPAALNAMPAGAPNNRLGLAQWLVDPANPLTARVQVNRYWEMFFGVGIVKSSENFGVQSEWPSHMELLDWLATEFVRTGWDIKAIQKKILMSATYRQSAKVSPDLLEMDPENRLLARGPRFRLQAEVIRDNALAAAGLLTEKIGGPPVRPYQPEGVWDETSVYGNLRGYKHDDGDALYRRSLYTIWKRTASPADMTMFDMPGREVCQVRRSRTNTPLQALTLMNEVTYVEAARVLAQRAMRQSPAADPAHRIAYAFELSTARPPTDAEAKLLLAGFNSHLSRFQAAPAAAKQLIAQGDSKADPALDPIELAAYTMTTSVILNLDETITKE